MATPRQLVETLAGVLGISVATVIVHDRNLSTAPLPLRTVAGRGRAAAKITAVDAANLLIAVAASESVKDSVRTVLTYGGLRAEKSKKRTGVRSFDELPASHTLGEALATLIDAAAAEEMSPQKFHLAFKFIGPRPMAFVEYSWNENDRSFDEFGKYVLKSKTKWSNEDADLERTTSFTGKTIFRVGAIVGVSV